MNSELILEMRGMKKTFPGVLAVDSVDLELKRGEILALLGENGAGKSTLMKILSGAYSADEGTILLDGQELKLYTPKDALDRGINVMYQELNNVEGLSIAENVFLGKLPRKGPLGIIDYKALFAKTKALLDELGLPYDPFTPLEKLRVAEKQLVEIAKSVSSDIRVLVMDEPTSALNEEEIRILFDILKKLASQGKSIIYISHRLDEVFEISDRVMVMRDGRRVGLKRTADTNKKELIEMMVGRTIEEMFPIGSREPGEVVFEVEDLSGDDIHDVRFYIRKGEIVGLYGLMGSGRTAIVETLFAARERKTGIVKIRGKKVSASNPYQALKAGIAYLPAERKVDGLVLIHSVKANVSLASLDKIKRKLFLNLGKETRLVSDWIRKLNVKTPSLNAAVESLSGGNQQKVVFSKWMMTDPHVLILNEPTRGIDVGAKVEIYKIIEEFCKKGIAILIVSSELPEIMSICDRIYTVYGGRITAEMKKGEYTQEKLLYSAIGEKTYGHP